MVNDGKRMLNVEVVVFWRKF